ncbi:hypothetical protein IJD44_01350 [bacterium]|nr:hypothetical protein [bacterium]
MRFKYAISLNDFKIELIRKDIILHNNWFSRINGYTPTKKSYYYIRYSHLSYHGIIEIHKTDNNKFSCMLLDGTIIECVTLKQFYKMRKNLVRQDIEFIDNIMEV